MIGALLCDLVRVTRFGFRSIRWRRLSFQVLSFFLLAAPAHAQLRALNPNETTNVQTVIDNLDSLIRSAETNKVKIKVRNADGEQVEVGAVDIVKSYKEVLANLKRKLQGRNLHGVNGLSDPNPQKKYVVGDPKTVAPSSPRAAFCVEGTKIWDGTAWVPCTPGDIVVDSKFTDPPENNGQPIDETTEAGWKQKWTLLHILVHEKWHERMINEQIELVKEVNKGSWATQSEEQKKKKLDIAEANGTTPEKHVEVYEAQKAILRLKQAVLEVEKTQLTHATPRVNVAIQRNEKQIEWIKKTWHDLETSMKKATKEREEFEFASCGGAGDLRDGTLAMYIVSLTTGYWRLDVDLHDGKLAGLRAPETFFFGKIYEEDPVPIPPSLYVVMPARIFTGLAVQPEPCKFLQWSTDGGYVVRSRNFSDVVSYLPKLAPEESQQNQSMLVGVVLPSEIIPGTSISGSVTLDPKRFEGIPALRVVQTETPLPLDADGHPTLQSMLVTVGSEKPRPAEDGFTSSLPSDTSKLSVRLNTMDGTSPLLNTSVSTNPTPSSEKPPSEVRPQDFTTPVACAPNSAQVIHGSFSGDSRVTQVTVDDVPAQIIAETSHAVYWSLPEGTQPGSHHLRVRDGSHGAAFMVTVISLEMSADRLTLARGESTAFRVVVRGLTDLPPSSWRANGRSELADETKLASSAPSFHLPQAGEDGALLLTLRNGSPTTVSIPNWHGESFAVTLHRENFTAGQYVYTGTILSKVSGQFVLSGTLTPFLAEQSGTPLP
jgi:hypothetical protein